MSSEPLHIIVIDNDGRYCKNTYRLITSITRSKTLLILTRRSNERIFIGDGIVLSVLAIEGNRVKLGIDAPKDVSILREEILDSTAELQMTEQSVLKAAGDS